MEIERASIQERFQHLYSVISGERFLKKQGLGNEIPFFICPFKPQEAVEMERLQKQLANRLEQNGVRVLDINLYDLCLSILKQEGDLDWYLTNEAFVTKSQLLEDLQKILDVEATVIPTMAKIMASTDFDVMFLSGVGIVFPLIRSHNVLNNLQSKAKEKPTLMFFPGTYTHSLEKGASLDLFGKLHDDKYYRAFNIFHCEP